MHEQVAPVSVSAGTANLPICTRVCAEYPAGRCKSLKILTPCSKMTQLVTQGLLLRSL